jgi:predicted transcriptional regulator
MNNDIISDHCRLLLAAYTENEALATANVAKVIERIHATLAQVLRVDCTSIEFRYRNVPILPTSGPAKEPSRDGV